MKLLSNSVRKLKLEIICEVEFNNFVYKNIAANNRIKLEYRDLIPEYQLTDDQFERYANFINSASSIISSFGFFVEDQYQSDESYSYYIKFKPDTYSGFVYVDENENEIELDVVFRLSDHRQKLSVSTKQYRFTEGHGSFFRSFIVAGVKKEKILDALTEIKEICKDLKVGDFSRLVD